MELICPATQASAEMTLRGGFFCFEVLLITTASCLLQPTACTSCAAVS